MPVKKQKGKKANHLTKYKSWYKTDILHTQFETRKKASIKHSLECKTQSIQRKASMRNTEKKSTIIKNVFINAVYMLFDTPDSYGKCIRQRIYNERNSTAVV